MPQREVLSPLTNNSLTPLRPPPTKFVSPSTSRTFGIASPTSALINFAEQDEGQQRKERRRKSQAFDLQRKILDSPSSSSPRPPDVLNGLTSTQLANHYADCIKLSAENKINAKNAFGLHLIDYMTELVKKKELENFQVASSTLDASVKIYAGRVDFIHSHTYKVLSGLGGGKNSKEEDDVAEDSGEKEDPDVMEIKSKKKRKIGKTHTLETNLKNLNVDKFDLEFEVDPMFQMMSAAFDEGGARGLLLNKLRCFDDSQQLVLDSSTSVNIVEDCLPDSQNSKKHVDLVDLKDMLSNLTLDDKQICSSLADFRFTEWDGNTSVMPKGFSDFAFDPSAESQHVPSVEEDLEAIAHEEIDDVDNAEDDMQEYGSVTSESDAFTKGDSRTAEFVESAFSDLTHGSVGKLRQILAMEPSDYSYFNKVLLRTWAGPAHWRIAPMSRTATADDASSKVQNKRQKKQPLKLTYDTPPSELDKMFQLSKATAVTKATWSKYTKKRTTLPEDQQLDSQDRLFRLFHRSQLMIKRYMGDSIGVDDGIDNYDYNNKNDVENFCPVVRDDDDDYGNSLSGGFDLSNETNFLQTSQDNMSQQNAFSDSGGLNGTILTQDKLVAAPNKVERIDIKYAKAAKRVDVRKLKCTMWSLLTMDKKLSIEETKSPMEPPLTEVNKMVIPHQFSLLKDVLPSYVSAGMAKNLTIQTVFACLLYITNEKTLKLSSTERMNDIDIQQDNGT